MPAPSSLCGCKTDGVNILSCPQGVGFDDDVDVDTDTGTGVVVFVPVVGVVELPRARSVRSLAGTGLLLRLELRGRPRFLASEDTPALASDDVLA